MGPVSINPDNTAPQESPSASKSEVTSEAPTAKVSPSAEGVSRVPGEIGQLKAPEASRNTDPDSPSKAERTERIESPLALLVKGQLEQLAGLRGALGPQALGVVVGPQLPVGFAQGALRGTPLGPNPLVTAARETLHESLSVSAPHSRGRSFANSDIVNRAAGPASSGQEPQSNFFMTRSTSTNQAAQPSSFGQKEVNSTSQRAASTEAKTEVANEPKRNDPRAELIAPDVSHKNIAQALEAAFDKILKGTATAPDSKTPPIQQPTQTQNELVANPTSSQATDKGPAQPTPQQFAQANQIQTSELIQAAISGLQQPRPQEHSPLPQQDLTQNQAARQNLEQTTEQMQQQRAEQLRLIQQIIASQTDPTPPLKTPTITPDMPLTTHPRHESTTVAVEKLRESIIDKFTAIQTQIETAAVERQRAAATTQPKDSAIQGRSTLDKATPVHHDAKPSQELRHGDRTNDPHRLSRTAAPGISLPLTALSQPQGALISHLDRSAFSLNSLGNALKTLQIFSRSSTNSQLIKRMDSALERTCLTLATGVAVGAVGAEILIKTVGLGIRELLRIVREGMAEQRNPTDEALEMELEAALDEYLVDGALVPSKRSMVADVSGVLICSETHQPLVGVLVGSRELGSCLTDAEGRFLFSNIPLGTSYGLKFYKPFFALSPDYVSGTCSFDSHHRVQIRLTALHANE